jgi:hypothetical protein
MKAKQKVKPPSKINARRYAEAFTSAIRPYREISMHEFKILMLKDAFEVHFDVSLWSHQTEIMHLIHSLFSLCLKRNSP